MKIEIYEAVLAHDTEQEVTVAIIEDMDVMIPFSRATTAELLEDLRDPDTEVSDEAAYTLTVSLARCMLNTPGLPIMWNMLLDRQLYAVLELAEGSWEIATAAANKMETDLLDDDSDLSSAGHTLH